MGRKVNPIGFRLGGVHTWDSRWYAERNYTELVQEDIRIRKLIMDQFTRAGISRIIIERAADRKSVV